MLNRVYQTKFIKDAEQQKKDLAKLTVVINLLLEEQLLSTKYKTHKLKRQYKGHWEGHIEPDWLLIYIKTNIEILSARTGTHSDLF